MVLGDTTKLALVITGVLLMRASFDWSFASLLAYANAVFVLIYLAAGLSGIKLLRGRGRYWAGLTTFICLVIAGLMGTDIGYGLAVFSLTFWLYYLIEKRAAHKLAAA